MIHNPFKEVAKQYVAKGISVIPAVYGKKGCEMMHWNFYCTKYPTLEELNQWELTQHNIGILTGELSGIIGFDFDYDVDGLQEKILKIIPDSPVKKKGSKGFTAFYRYNGEKSRSFRKNGETILDILSDGKLTIMPPSLHPNGMLYEWVDENHTLLNTPKEQLPIVTDAMMEKIKSLFVVQKLPSFNTSLYNSNRSTEVDDIKEALDYISPDCDYNTWVQVGMALADFFNGDLQGASIFNDWSSKGSKYKGWNEIKSKYDSFKNNGITINTLFSYAMEGGFIRKSSEATMGDMERLSEEENKKLDIFLSQNFNKKVEAVDLESKIIKAPGLVGQIAEYINDVSLFRQPVLAMAAAITAAGTVYGQKIRSETDLRTNLYCVAIAESGSGKDQPRKAILSLFDKVGPDIKKHFIGKPASDSGLMSALEESGGVALMQIDEFGHYLKGINNKDNPKYLAAIASLLTELYSTASSTLMGQQYSNRQTNAKRIDIEQPCVCVLGSTVPDRLYNAVSKDEILDGFLTRWIFFESDDYDPGVNISRKDIQSYIPIQLVENIRNIRRSYAPRSAGEGDFVGSVKIKARIVPFSPEAELIANDYFMRIKKKRNEAIENGDLMKVVYTRSYENMMKLALVASEVVDNRLTITRNSIEWAINVITYSNEKFRKIIGDHISSSPYEKNLNDMYNELKKKKKAIKESSFNYMFKRWSIKDRINMLQDLQAQGRVVVNKSEDNIKYISAV